MAVSQRGDERTTLLGDGYCLSGAAGGAATKEFEAAVASLRDIAQIGARADQYIHIHSFVFAVARKAFDFHPRRTTDAFEGLVKRFLDDIPGQTFRVWCRNSA
jgi:hypothetical protein